MDYETFLKNKLHRTEQKGFAPVWMPDFLFDFQSHIVDWSIRLGRAAIFADCGLGKGQVPDSNILTPDGYVKLKDLKVGDLVISSSGKPYPVIGVYPKSKRPIFKVTFSDGNHILVDEDHLHICRTNNDRQRNKPWRVMSTTDLLNCGNIRYGKNGKSKNYDIPIVKPVEFYGGDVGLPIHPYLLGALLGDGHIKGSVSISTVDISMISNLNKILPEGCSFEKTGYGCDYRLVTGQTGTKKHPLREFLVSLGLYGKLAHEKHIPSRYLLASNPKDRLELLRGLMDTDGFVEKKSGCCQYYTSSPQLCEDVKFLIQSLGGVPTHKIKKTTHRDSHVLTFSLKTFNPFHLKRKRERWNPKPRDNGRWIESIEPAGESETICISVDSPDQSYVTDNFVVTHNTPVQLVWAENIVRKTGKNVLILCPLAVSEQTIREGQKFGITVTRSKDGTVHKGITITNYERLHYFNPKDFVGIVCDESGILKGIDRSTRIRITKFAKQIRYRLLCTATPAPNDYMELGSSAEALGVMKHTQMLGMFFENGQDQTQQWSLKPHAQKRFWQWMGTWARALRKPSDLGFDDRKFILPPLITHRHTVPGFKHGLLTKMMMTLDDQRKERKRTLQERCELVASLVPKDKPCLVWCHLNPEGDLLEKLIPDAVQVAGRDKDDIKERRLNDFSTGNIRVMVTKPQIAGFGLNWQICSNVTFFPSHSAEQFYQAIRRCWRFGQKNEVHCNLVFSESETPVLENMLRKEKQAEEMYASIVREMNYKPEQKNGQATKQMKLPSWLT